MNRRLWSGIIAAVLLLGTLSGCSDGSTSNAVPKINTDNPATASITHSSTNSDTSSSKSPGTGSTSSSSTTSSLQETVSAELMETLDGYEEFFKDYTEYLKVYKSGSESELQYYASRSEEISKLLDEYDESSLNIKEEIYLADVKYRISKMLDGVKDKLPVWNAESGKYEVGTSSSASSSSSSSSKKPVSTSRTPVFSKAPTSLYTGSTVPGGSSIKPNTSFGGSTVPSSSRKPSSSSSSESAISSSTSVSSPELEYSYSEQESFYEQPQPSHPLSEIMDIPEPDTSTIITDYTGKWGYNQLNETQKIMYARLYESARNNSGAINVTDLGLSESSLNVAFWAFDYDNPQFLTLGSGYSYSYNSATRELVDVTIEYGRSAGEVPTSQFESTARSVINDALQMGSDYERLKYIHDWIVNNTSYTYTGPEYINEADGPVVYGSALCEGYSKAFMYMAQSMGYECICVSGYSNGDHMWNMVKVGGTWYHVDVTWDDPISSSGPVLRYNYFLVSDSTIGRDHTVDNYIAVPSAPYDYQ